MSLLVDFLPKISDDLQMQNPVFTNSNPKLFSLFGNAHGGYLIDCLVSAKPGSVPVPAHSFVLAEASNVFRRIIQSREFKNLRLIQLDIPIPNATRCLKAAIDFIYTGQLNMEGVTQQQMQTLADHISVLSLQERLKMQQMQQQQDLSFPLFQTSFSQLQLLNALNLNNPLQPIQQSVFEANIANMFSQLVQQVQVQQQATPIVAPTTLIGGAPQNMAREVIRRRRVTSESSILKKQQSDEETSSNDQLIQSSDKEGWCRNKKYIEKTENGGYMCTVCNKVYGRYNSVSYHVTIYHRNPPIKCDFQDCQFTTREARYIHFHKYYRHNVALPPSIDQGSRKCPYCKHVSKSPAMLEKHIKRHRQNETDHLKSSSPDSTRSGAPSISETIFEDLAFEVRPRTVSEIPAMETVVDVEKMDEDVEEEYETKSRAFTM